jgi:hypothetical protein
VPPESTGHVIDGDLWDSYYPAGRDKGTPSGRAPPVQSGAQNKRDNDSIRDNARLSLWPEPKVIHSSGLQPDDATSTAKMLAPQRLGAAMRRLFGHPKSCHSAGRPSDNVVNLVLVLGYAAASGGMQVLRQWWQVGAAQKVNNRRPKEEAINLHVSGRGAKNGGRRYQRRFTGSLICNETASPVK